MYEISVIVPVYNCERYLTRSINSLLGQTVLDQMQIIFIDDGSQDNSFQILKRFSTLYENIIVLHQENKGVSSARNLGLKLCKGKYIAFFDADDEASPKLYETLVKICNEYDADISIVDYTMFFEDGRKKKHRRKEFIVWDNQSELLIDYFKTNRICSNPVDKLFRADIIKNIAFPEGYAIGEDLYFVYQALKNAKRVVMDSSNSLYNYIIHEHSAMKSIFSSKYLDPIKLMELIMKENTRDDLLYNFIEAKYYNEICKALSILVKKDKDNNFIFIKKKLQKQLNSYSLEKAFKYMSSKHFFALLIMKLSPKFYNFIYDFLHIG